MAKNPQDSNEVAQANGSELPSDANPYVNEDASSGKRFGWIKGKPAKIAAISVGGALALGAVFAGGAVAGQIASHNGGPSFSAPFENEKLGQGHFDGKPGEGHFGGQDDFGPRGDEGLEAPDGAQFGKHAPRPPHDFDGESEGAGEDDAPQLGGLNTPGESAPTAPKVQSN